MASTYLQRTFGTPTNRKKFTISVWVKKSLVNSANGQYIWNGYYSTDNRLQIYFQASGEDTLGLYNVAGGSANAFLLTNRKFRDSNAWYHIYYAVDTTQSTASDRIKLYVNGVQETSFSNDTYPSQNADMTFANGYTNYIGRYGANTNSNFDGSMSYFYFVDGSVIDIAQFGSTDSTTGEWKINTSPTISSYGNEGFLILKDGNTITDQSSNSNNFTVGAGTLTKTEDNPSNVFATFNSLSKNDAGTVTFSNGNLKVAHSGTDSAYNSYSTIGLTSGKWYSEFKYEATSGGSDMMVGMSYDPENKNRTGTIAGADTTGFGYWSSNGDIYTNGNHSSFGNSYAVGDIVGMATDLDNNKVYFSKNGVWQNSGDPTSGATGTGSAIDLTANQTYFLIVTHATTTTRTTTYSANFGNGYFGTTAVSSAGTNASGIGIFEYDVPTGYTALSTKGLNL